MNFFGKINYFCMRVHLIRKETIEEFCLYNAQSRTPFREWLSKLKFANWETASNIKETFSAADILGRGSNRVVFDIGGNNYRMICKYAFGERQVHLFVCWIGTHKQYDELCKRNDQYIISNY